MTDSRPHGRRCDLSSGSMKFKIATCMLGGMIFWSGCSMQTEVHIGQPSEQFKPKLVVGITVDQMRADYLTRFGAWRDDASNATFGEGGFRRMINEGFACRDHHFGYALTYTPPAMHRFTRARPRPFMAFWPTIGSTENRAQACTVPLTLRCKVCMEVAWTQTALYLDQQDKCPLIAC